jgi:hypothetical protein
MTAREAIRVRLGADAAVAADIPATRWYNWRRVGVTAVRPYGVIRTVDADSHQHMGGASGLQEARLWLYVYADTQEKVDEITENVRLALQGYSGTVAGSPPDELVIQAVFYKGFVDDFEETNTATDKGLATATLDFTVWHEQAIPS